MRPQSRIAALSLLILLAVSAVPVRAQAATARLLPKELVGEKLVFEGKINKLKLNLSIAELTFTVAAQGNEDAPSAIVIRSEAVSKGTMLKLFRYSFLQQYESIVDPTDFRIRRTVKHDVQKQRVRDSEALFDYQTNRVTYVETDPKDRSRPPRTIASEITPKMNDMISAIYAVRLADLNVGTRMELAVSDTGLVYKVPLSVTKRERLSTPFGKVWCFRVEPDIFGPGRLIERKGKMVIWLTEDKLHTPVKAQVDSEYGRVEIKLKSAVNPA